MKEQKEEVELDPAATRLLELIEELGGAAPVARAMGKHPQLLYNIRDGRSKFSLTTLTELALAFPGKVDANYIVFGVASDNVPHISKLLPEKKGQQTQSITLDDRAPNGKPWKEVAEEYRVKFENMQSKLLEKHYPELFTDKEGIKIRSSSYPTDLVAQQIEEFQRQQCVVYGLVRYDHDPITTMATNRYKELLCFMKQSQSLSFSKVDAGREGTTQFN